MGHFRGKPGSYDELLLLPFQIEQIRRYLEPGTGLKLPLVTATGQVGKSLDPRRFLRLQTRKCPSDHISRRVPSESTGTRVPRASCGAISFAEKTRGKSWFDDRRTD